MIFVYVFVQIVIHQVNSISASTCAITGNKRPFPPALFLVVAGVAAKRQLSNILIWHCGIDCSFVSQLGWCGLSVHCIGTLINAKLGEGISHHLRCSMWGNPVKMASGRQHLPNHLWVPCSFSLEDKASFVGTRTRSLGMAMENSLWNLEINSQICAGIQVSEFLVGEIWWGNYQERELPVGEINGWWNFNAKFWSGLPEADLVVKHFRNIVLW